MAKKQEESQVEFTETQIKHLEFIQGVINRMGSNSFQMKSWMLVVATALLGSYANTGNKSFALLAIFPTLIFWFLDTYYLQQERKFRGVYDDVAGISKEPKDIKPFAMPINLYNEKKHSFWDVFGSFTIVMLYASIIIVLLAIYFLM